MKTALNAGQIRNYNITKKEWVLKGDTVIYASWNNIKETLDYGFNTEKEFQSAIQSAKMAL